MPTSSKESVFQLNLPSRSFLINPLLSAAEIALSRLLALPKLADTYDKVCTGQGTREFLINVQKEFGVTCRLHADDLERIPSQGPTIVVANHPFGAIDGIILAMLLLNRRSDTKIMANHLLGRIPELRDIFLLVDPFENRRAKVNNIRPVRQAMRWLESGGLLATFPSGEVSHLKLKQRTVIDPQWKNMVANLVKKTGATVVPAYFLGANSLLFQLMGLVHPRLRTALLPRELLKKRNHTIELHLGSAIPPKTLESYKDLRSMTEYLRWRTYLLRYAGPQRRSGIRRIAFNRTVAKRQKIAPAQQSHALQSHALQGEIDALPYDQILVEAHEFKVFQARRNQIPTLMMEIGRSREISFRRAGEGTGRSLDLDSYDDHYLHLVLWNQKKNELVGCYRLGLTDEILPQYGPQGIYTSSLFKFKADFFSLVHPAVELGRSFVSPAYQRAYSSLMLLWKGIGRFLAQNPRYRYLFGPVSVSDIYRPLSQKLIVRYFDLHHASPLVKLVRAKRPARFPASRGLKHDAFLGNLLNIEELSDVIQDIENQKRGVPVLLKQYLKLGAKAAGWNVDPDFGNALDCLMIADLLASEPKAMIRYQGQDEYRAYMDYHQNRQPQTLQDCA